MLAEGPWRRWREPRENAGRKSLLVAIKFVPVRLSATENSNVSLSFFPFYSVAPLSEQVSFVRRWGKVETFIGLDYQKCSFLATSIISFKYGILNNWGVFTLKQEWSTMRRCIIPHRLIWSQLILPSIPLLHWIVIAIHRKIGRDNRYEFNLFSDIDTEDR